MEEKKKYLGNFDKWSTRIIFILFYPCLIIIASVYGIVNGIKELNQMLKRYF